MEKGRKNSSKYLIVIVGPTAVGKTTLSLYLSDYFKTSIISADSRQVFREMEIGTAKPSPEELIQAKHYFINSHSIEEDFSAGKFETQALEAIDYIFNNSDIAIMVGGSGLYVSALCHGMDDMPVVNQSIRESIVEKYKVNGIEKLLEELRSLDNEYYQRVDKNNPQRIMRALEIYYATQKPYSSFRIKEPIQRNFNIIKIGLEQNRQALYQRINTRMDVMIAKGLFEEATLLFPRRHLNALQTVGYTEIFEYLEGKYDKTEAIRLLKRNSRRYAKRQLTWFKRDNDIRWFQPEQRDEILKHILSAVNAKIGEE